MVQVAEKNSFLADALQSLWRTGNSAEVMNFAHDLLPRRNLHSQIHGGVGTITYCTVSNHVLVREKLGR